MTQQNTDERPGIAAAIVVHEGRVLMVRRRVSEGQLSWQFPAGEVEPGEAREDAAVRETQEETGLTVAAVKLADLAIAEAAARLVPRAQRVLDGAVPSGGISGPGAPSAHAPLTQTAPDEKSEAE
ncbi:NUDIX hydrolase [Streptomyces nodosus]